MYVPGMYYYDAVYYIVLHALVGPLKLLQAADGHNVHSGSGGGEIQADHQGEIMPIHPFPGTNRSSDELRSVVLRRGTLPWAHHQHNIRGRLLLLAQCVQLFLYSSFKPDFDGSVFSLRAAAPHPPK